MELIFVCQHLPVKTNYFHFRLISLKCTDLRLFWQLRFITRNIYCTIKPHHISVLLGTYYHYFSNQLLVIPFQYKAQQALLGGALPTASLLASTILEYNTFPLWKASARTSTFLLPATKTIVTFKSISSQHSWNLIPRVSICKICCITPSPCDFPEKLVKIPTTTCHQSTQDCAMQAEAMAQQPPSLEDILGQVTALQGQLTTLQQLNRDLQNQLNAIQNAPNQPAGQASAWVVVEPTFSLTPATANLMDLIDYSSKLGQSI